MATELVEVFKDKTRRLRSAARTEKLKYSQLSSVAWVNSTWVVLALGSILTVSLIPALLPYRDGSLPLMVALCVTSLILMYPYIHYRVNGGAVMRIPPRYVFDKPVFDKKNL